MSKRKSKEVVTQDDKKNIKKPKKTSHWSLGLLSAVENPDLLVKSDDLVFLIKDGYPKAEFHYLVIPKEDITSLKSVTTKHINLLKHMESIALEITTDEKHGNKTFQIGYHAEPSMSRLHLHVISDDMNSDCLKNKKHWNSFTTNFFLLSKDVIKQLEDTGTILIPSRDSCKKFMETPLKCHKCTFVPKNMPELKKHILSHQ